MSKKFEEYGSNDSLAIDQGDLTEDTIGDAYTAALANFGAPNQMVLDPGSLRALHSFFHKADHPIMERIKGMIHGNIKLGKISWEDRYALENAAKALESMGFWKYADKE